MGDNKPHTFAPLKKFAPTATHLPDHLWREVHSQEICQVVCLSLIGLDWKYGGLAVCFFKPLQKFNSWPFSGNPGINLARVHHLGQYLINACFKFGSKL